MESSSFLSCFPCCSSFSDYSAQAMQFIDRALGNIKTSHKNIDFIGLLNIRHGKAKIVHHLASEEIHSNVNVPKDDDVTLSNDQIEKLHEIKVKKA